MRIALFGSLAVMLAMRLTLWDMSGEDRAPDTEDLNLLFDAFDADGDGLLNETELDELEADLGRQMLDLKALCPSGGASKTDLEAYYTTVITASLSADCALALEPRVESLFVLGAAAVVTLALGLALRRRLKAALLPDNRVLVEVGRGQTRVRAGWLLAGNRQSGAGGFQFVDPSGEATASLQQRAKQCINISPEGQMEISSPEEAPDEALQICIVSRGSDDDDDDAGSQEDEKSRAYKSARDFKVLKESDPAFVPMDDFKGNSDVRRELEELVELLKSPDRYAKLGAVPPRGVLFCGEPGTGKTFAAQAVASQAGVPFVAISGSDFRQSPYSGVGTSMTLMMFEKAKKLAPCVIFIDEIDSVGEARRSGPTAFQDAGELGGSVTRDQDSNLNMILAKMDGFQPSSGVLVLAATNRPEVLDEALLRPGRFDRRIEFRLPDAQGRAEILKGYSGRIVFGEGEALNMADLAKRTPAFSPADLQGLLNDSATAAARAGQEAVLVSDVEDCLVKMKKRKAKARPEGAFQVTESVDVTLQDVRGHDEALEELRDLVDVLVDRERYKVLGAVPPRGVLLEGPPGVGKTLCARALAGEIGLPFLQASGSDFQAGKFAGQGIQLVKRLFAYARKLQPCIVFIDEIDALGRQRGAEARGAEQDRESTLMQLFVELDGFDERSDILLVAATNRADVLDPALLRPGRLDRRVALELPDQAGRRAVLDIHSSSTPLAPDVDLDELARRTSGFSGADLRNLVNEAALLAAKQRAKAVPRECVFRAADRIMLGLEKANPMRSGRARRLTAVHEAGHAVLGLAFGLLSQRRVARASIRPRAGGIGGVTVFEPPEEGSEGVLPAGIFTRQGCLSSLCVDLGGRVAEETLAPWGEVSSGASSDLQVATQRAMAMAADWGLCSEASGSAANAPILSLGALGRRCSDATLRQVELAASSVLTQALGSARNVLRSTAGRACLELVTERLLASEELGAEELFAAPLDVASLQAAAAHEAEHWAL
ncbi:unnamed protein product [Polarella glacialis]|uniref:EF-hand domain-containing protein n=1 Tax=Polarella glacialis TaxID=89957 RepID=A0A813KAK6_POLGL|nr:unnamed protein product [Polarella glacialis]